MENVSSRRSLASTRSRWMVAGWFVLLAIGTSCRTLSEDAVGSSKDDSGKGTESALTTTPAPTVAVTTTPAPAVAVPKGDQDVVGELKKEEIESVIKANLEPIKTCYERALKSNRDLAGRVTTIFTIGTDGSVTGASVASSELGSPGAEECIVSAIRGWKFPAPRGGGKVQVKYPFIFNAR